MFGLSRREEIGALLLALLLVCGMFLRYFFWAKSSEEIIIETAETRQEEVKEKEIAVHVAGAVATPGVYSLHDGARVIDAIEKAGGLLSGGDEEALNLAAPLFDGQKIVVPLVTEAAESADTMLEGLVNINTATAAELETLPGIGAVKAAAIVRFREENGPFRQVEDLTQVAGIGAKTVGNLKDHITLY